MTLHHAAPNPDWRPDPNVHAGYSYVYVAPFVEFDYVWVPAWNCVAVVLEVTNGASVRVTDRLTNRDGCARFEFFMTCEVEAYVA